MKARFAIAKLGYVKTSVTCSCGFVAHGETAERLLAHVEEHIAYTHARASADNQEPSGQKVVAPAVAGLTKRERAERRRSV